MNREVVKQSNGSPEERLPQIGMDQLDFFVRMVENYLQSEKHFWKVIRQDCPQLMRAIEVHFFKQWSHITFTRDLHSPAFDPDLIFGDEDQPQQKEQLPAQLQPEQECRI